jgi:UDP-N-acetyl-D-galactosamine dehydrogenase
MKLLKPPAQNGLVGGHCIGVDPYYLTFQAKKMGFEPEMILSGRRINDHMSKYVASEVAKRVFSNGKFHNTPKCHILGATFKENCADMRNSKILDLYNELKSFGLEVLLSDPFADPKVAMATYGSNFIDEVGQSEIDALILAVPHRTYTEKPAEELVKNIRDGGWVIDIKSALAREKIEGLGLNLWSL